MNTSFAAPSNAQTGVEFVPSSSSVPETLTDNLLDDLDDLSDDDDEDLSEINSSDANPDPPDTEEGSRLDDPGSALESAPESAPFPLSAFRSDTRAARSLALSRHLDLLRTTLASSSPPDHATLVESNRHLSALSECAAAAHDHLVRHVAVKFPELADLVPDQSAYRSCVLAIGNEMDLTLVHDKLGKILPGSAVLAASVAGSTTVGRPFTKEELADVVEICEEMERAAEVEQELVGHLERTMGATAPNLTALVGSGVAARIVGIAGGVAELARIPACNIQVLGQVKRGVGGAPRRGGSEAPPMSHAGVISWCQLVQDAPGELKQKTLKAVAAKAALAARCDAAGARSDHTGLKYRAEIERKVQQWDEPDASQNVRALPKPDLSTKKRRGGRRVRRMKERFVEGSVSKQMNQRAFRAPSGEYGDDAMGLTLGMLDSREGGGTAATGSVRGVALDKRKLSMANTKASRKRALKVAASGKSSSGMASSMVLTAAQGMELVDPDAARRAAEERVRAANARWFGESSGFKSALPK